MLKKRLKNNSRYPSMFEDLYENGLQKKLTKYKWVFLQLEAQIKKDPLVTKTHQKFSQSYNALKVKDKYTNLKR